MTKKEKYLAETIFVSGRKPYILWTGEVGGLPGMIELYSCPVAMKLQRILREILAEQTK